MKEDVYVTIWRMGDEFRVSLHGEREDQAAVAQQAITKQTRDQVGLQSRILQRWPRVAASRHFEPDFEIIALTSELYSEPEGDDDFANVTWIPAAPSNGGVQVCICFHNPLAGDGWPGQSLLGSQLLARFELRDERSCWIVAITRDEVPPEFREQLRRGKTGLRRTDPTFVVGDPSLEEVGTRVQLGMGKNGRLCGWIEASFQGGAPAA